MKRIILILSIFYDLSVLFFVMPIIRIIMIKSPLFNGAEPQWTSRRYWISGIFAAATYFLLALTSDFYTTRKKVKCTKIPAVNFVIISFVFFLGLLACWRYGVITDGMQLISRRVLLFSMVISYFLTTLIHYLIALYFNKEKL
ncbi:MAG: hypothetical protein DRI44_03610 [Chlamydiae bacterium]|nr:MAG: hypothetical protein DRI44_03610 [Chlamydiota bacterium]